MQQLHPPKKTKARKEHKCDLCGLKIDVGAIYLRSTHKTDDFYSFKSHLYCVELIQKLQPTLKYKNGFRTTNFIELIKNKHSDLSHHKNSAFSKKLEAVLNHFDIKK